MGRLMICYFVEYSEDWENERSCIREDKVRGSVTFLVQGFFAHT